jgi:hypothetical protein
MAARSTTSKSTTETSVTVNFTKFGETKGTFRYSEDDNGAEPVVGSLYVKKHAAEKLGNPEKLVVVITVIPAQ